MTHNEPDLDSFIASAVPPFDRVQFIVHQYPRLFRGRAPEFSDISKGWLPLLTQMLTDIDRLLDDDHAARFRVKQIKGKFGSMRFYWALGDEQTTVKRILGEPGKRLECGPTNPSPLFLQLRQRVAAAQQVSGETCEACSRPASIDRHDGWLYALCETCAARFGAGPS